jgi:hypothetical protein
MMLNVVTPNTATPLTSKRITIGKENGPVGNTTTKVAA